MKILQINTTVNTGSTGRIAEDIGRKIISKGWESFIAFSRNEQESSSYKIKIGSKRDQFFHLINSRLLDNHGLSSISATKTFISSIKMINPDIIHIHNLHGYYINYQILFEYIINSRKKIVWTFHDCWPFTGHCAHFERIKCYKWKTQCNNCPGKHNYPSSYIFDNSFENYNIKKELFTKIIDLGIIVTPSLWLKNYVDQSFLKNIRSTVIHNGIDTNLFTLKNSNIKSKFDLLNKHVVLAVANIFTPSKGIEDIIKLSTILPDNFKIIIIGNIDTKYKIRLNNNIYHISRTENIEELSNWYSAATVFINPTYSDNFPTTAIEALACGTPVITYDTGGCGEAIDKFTGSLISKGDVYKMREAIIQWSEIEKIKVATSCRKRAFAEYNKEAQFDKYIDLYQQI